MFCLIRTPQGNAGIETLPRRQTVLHRISTLRRQCIPDIPHSGFQRNRVSDDILPRRRRPSGRRCGIKCNEISESRNESVSESVQCGKFFQRQYVTREFPIIQKDGDLIDREQARRKESASGSEIQWQRRILQGCISLHLVLIKFFDTRISGKSDYCRHKIIFGISGCSNSRKHQCRHRQCCQFFHKKGFVGRM